MAKAGAYVESIREVNVKLFKCRAAYRWKQRIRANLKHWQINSVVYEAIKKHFFMTRFLRRYRCLHCSVLRPVFTALLGAPLNATLALNAKVSRPFPGSDFIKFTNSSQCDGENGGGKVRQSNPHSLRVLLKWHSVCSDPSLLISTPFSLSKLPP